MNTVARLDLNTGALSSSSFSGQFMPHSSTAGEFQLNKLKVSYLISPMQYGYAIRLRSSGNELAVREYDVHEGTNSVSVGGLSLETDNHDLGIVYAGNDRVGRICFTPEEVTIELTDAVSNERIGLVAALLALDTMWANLIGFTRTKPGVKSALFRSAMPVVVNDSTSKRTSWWKLW